MEIIHTNQKNTGETNNNVGNILDDILMRYEENYFVFEQGREIYYYAKFVVIDLC